MSEKIEALDLVINVLREHEKKLDELIEHLEKYIKNTTNQKPDLTKAYRLSMCGEELAVTIMFIIEKDLTEEYKKFREKWYETWGQKETSQ